MGRPLFHPTHRSMMPGFEPALELEPGGVGCIGRRKAAGGKAEPFGLRPYCFLKALAVIHLHQLPVRPELVEGLPL